MIARVAKLNIQASQKRISYSLSLDITLSFD